MHISTNLAHWVCVLAGLYLVVSSLLLRDVLSDRPQSSGLPPAHYARARRVAYRVGRRGVMIAVGLAAMAYGIFRLL